MILSRDNFSFVSFDLTKRHNVWKYIINKSEICVLFKILFKFEFFLAFDKLIRNLINRIPSLNFTAESIISKTTSSLMEFNCAKFSFSSSSKKIKLFIFDSNSSLVKFSLVKKLKREVLVEFRLFSKFEREFVSMGILMFI